MRWKEKAKERDEFLVLSSVSIRAFLRAMDKGLRRAIWGALLDFDLFEDGRIKDSSKNVNLANKLTNLVSQQSNKNVSRLGERIVEKMFGLFKKSSDYFDEFEEFAGTVTEETALEKVMKAYGYDAKAKRFLTGGYLEAALDGNPAARKVATALQAAIQQNKSIKEITEQFNDEFVLNGGLLERHYSAFVNDLLFSFQRQAAYQSAVALGFTKFVYAGTVVEATREFCEQRNNIVYDIDFAKKWDEIEWQGKRPNIPFFIQQGGHRCRHTFNFVSDMVADFIASSSGFQINELRPVEKLDK
jgi:hypothetical protein